MTETQWRFLKAISDRVPDGRIVEVRLFPTIRQGGAESGVAVVAVEGPFGAAVAVQGDSTDDASSPTGESAGWGRGASIDAPSAAQLSLTDAHVPDDAGGEPLDAIAVDHDVARMLDANTMTVDDVADSPQTLDGVLDLATDEAVPAQASPQGPKRYAVLAARYRLTLKGPDRGQWDFEITHEADAPLDTVDRVARGVARRAGDDGVPESFSAFQLRSALAQPWWNSAT